MTLTFDEIAAFFASAVALRKRADDLRVKLLPFANLDNVPTETGVRERESLEHMLGEAIDVAVYLESHARLALRKWLDATL